MAIAAPSFSLDDKYTREDGTIFLTGVQALVRLPLDQARADRRAGLRTARYVSGYQGSPLGGYDSELRRHRALLADHDVVHQPGQNEELAATAVMGSQLAATMPGARYDGVVGIWYGKGPGLDRASDALRHANLIGVGPRGGALAIVGDDPLAKSSTLPIASETALYDLHMPTFFPGDVQEVLDLGLHALALSRASGLWAAMKMTANVADGFGTAQVGPDRIRPVAVAMELEGQPYVHRPTATLMPQVTLELERTLHGARLVAARAYARANGLNRIVRGGPDDRVGLVAAGKTFVDLRQALRDLGLEDDDLERLGVRLLKIGMLYPLDDDVVREFARGLREVVVVEEKRPLIELLLKDALYGVGQAPLVVGKLDEEGLPLVPVGGELEPDAIARAIGPRLAALAEVPSVQARLDVLARAAPLAPLSLARSPWFCSGCPHNSSTKVPDGATIGGGIGCHVMVALMPEHQVGDIAGLTQMGGEGAQFIGLGPFTDTGHFIQNLGDGTFAHSGSLAIRAAVAAGANITYKILHNSTVAMTGGQDAVGSPGVPAMAQMLLAEGVRRIIVTTEGPERYRDVELPHGVEVWDRHRIVEAQEALGAVPGVTALIHDQECATELRRKRKRGKAPAPLEHVFINERVCEGCGDCGEKSNCLSVHPVDTEFGRKTQIHQASCNQDLTCLDGDCPSFLEVIPAEGGRAAPAIAELSADDLPAPTPRLAPDAFAMRITGVGGTGVVTVAQILGVAGLLDGRTVRGLDQTGLAQKGGPVVSDLKLTGAPAEVASKLADAECDLYLGCDLLVAGEAKNLVTARPGHTIAVLSTAEVPTGRMVVDTSAAFPDGTSLVERIDRRTTPDANVHLDSQRLAGRLFGTDQAANMLLVGAAHQAGALPLSAKSIERTIEVNGVAVRLNLQAFRRGRQAVADPAALAAALDEAMPPPPARTPVTPEAQRLIDHVGAPAGGELERLVRIRILELVDYQDAGYAARYAALVARVRAAEAQRAPGRSGLAEAVAFGLHKLMAYKDEYEVARLHLDTALRTAIEAEFGPGARVAWKLHPPVLRALGLQRKLTLGPWFTPAYRVLRGMRRLRGRRLDPFGHAEVRRVERALIVEYEALVEEILAGLGPANHEIAVELAALPDMVRGYEEIKLRNVDRYHTRVAELRAALHDPAPRVVTVAA